MNRLSLKTAFKSIVKYPGVSAINWAGLSLGLTVCGFIALFVQHEYRIDMQWWMFVLAGAGAITVAFLTVSFQSVRAALMNPVKSLRSE
jgi:ABC-type antimicrobial peptide transport system permease subunit